MRKGLFMIVMEKQDLRVLALLLQLKEQQVMLGYIQMDRTSFFLLQFGISSSLQKKL
jgi:hypothetical protein